MPVIIEQQINEDTTLIVWQVTENIQELKQYVNNRVTENTMPQKDTTLWLASRACLLHHFNEPVHIIKDIYNKPMMRVANQHYHLSISHSFQYAAVIFSKLRPVAIDLEKIDPRIVRVRQKFCTDKELAFAGDEISLLTGIWSGKEALYKMYGQKELIFNRHLFVEQSDNGIWYGRINKDDFDYSCIISHLDLPGYILCYITGHL